MTYRVRIIPTALADAEGFYLWIAEDSPVYAAKWFNGLFDVIDTLASMPRRCPVAPEAEIVGQEIRCLLYLKRYRILYENQARNIRVKFGIRSRDREWFTASYFQFLSSCSSFRLSDILFTCKSLSS